MALDFSKDGVLVDAPDFSGFGTLVEPSAKPAARGIISAAAPDIASSDPMSSGFDETMAVSTPARTSVLEGLQMDKPVFNADEANRLSDRKFAEDSQPVTSKQRIERIDGKTIPINEQGTFGRAGGLIGTQLDSYASGLGYKLGDAAESIGAKAIAKDLKARAFTLSDRADDKNLSISLSADGAFEKYAPQILAVFPTMAVAASTGAVLPAMFGISEVQSYAEGRKAGLTPGMALGRSIPTATAEVLGEMLGGTGKLITALEKAVVKGGTIGSLKELSGRMLASGMREVPSEEATYAMQFGIDKMPGIGLKPNAGIDDFIEGAKDTAIVAAGAGGMMAGGGMAVSRMAARGQPVTNKYPVPPATLPGVPPAPVDPVKAITDPAKTLDQSIASFKASVQTPSAPAATQSIEAVGNIDKILQAQGLAGPTGIISGTQSLTADIAAVTQKITDLETANAQGIPPIAQAAQAQAAAINPAPEAIAAGLPVPAAASGVSVNADAALQSNAPLAVEQVAAKKDPASWVIRNKETGEVVMETFDKAKVDALNTAKYEAVPIQDYLVGVNQQIKAAEAKPVDQRLIPVSKRVPDVQNQSAPESVAKAKTAPAQAPETRTGTGIQPAAAGSQGGNIALEGDGLKVTFDGKTYPVNSIRDAQNKWNQFRDQSGGGVSEVGNGVQVTNGKGQTVAKISYNGRAWDAQDNEIGVQLGNDVQVNKEKPADQRLIPVSKRTPEAAPAQKMQAQAALEKIAPNPTKDLADARAGLAGLESKRKLTRGSKRADIDGQIERVKATIDELESATDKTPVADIRLGRDNVPIHRGGKPYTLHRDAKKAKAKQPMMRVMRVEGGYALAPKTEKQLAAETAAARRLRNPNTGPAGEPISAHAFIAAEGMLNADTKADLNIGANPRIGNRTLFAGVGQGGLTMEQATERLIEEGYLPEDASQNQAMALIKRSLDDPQYTPEGVERIAEKEAEQQRKSYDAEQEAIALAQEAEDNQFAAAADAYEAAMLDYPADVKQSDMSREDAFLAMGFTEQEYQDAIAEESRGPQSSGQAGPGPAEVAARPGAQNNSGRESAPSSDSRSGSEEQQAAVANGIPSVDQAASPAPAEKLEAGQAEIDEAKGLKYKTPDLQYVLADDLDPTDGFDMMRLAYSLGKARDYNRIMAAYDGDIQGIEFKKPAEPKYPNIPTKYAFVLPDASEPGKWRVSYFDKDGFSRHDSELTREAAQVSLVTDGFTIEDKGALDRLASTKDWARGTAYANLIMQMNRGEISLAQLNEAQRKLNDDYQSEKAALANAQPIADGLPGSDARSESANAGNNRSGSDGAAVNTASKVETSTRPEELIELRKRKSILETLRNCVGGT